MSTMRTPCPSGNTMRGLRSRETSRSPSAWGHPPKADKRFLQRGYVGGLFAAEPLKEFGGLETVDHRFRPCGESGASSSETSRSSSTKMPQSPDDDRRSEGRIAVDPGDGFHDVAGHHALDEHPFPAGIGWWRFMDRSSSSHGLPQGPRVSYIELDEPGFRLVRDVRRDALERHGIADGFGGGLCFFGRLGQAFAQGRDAEVGENPRRQRVGDDAAAGVQLGKEIGGKGRGASVSSGRGLFQSSHAATAPTPSVLPCRAGTPPSSRILRMDGSIPPEMLDTTTTGLPESARCPHCCCGHVGELGDLFVRHIGGHVLRDE